MRKILELSSYNGNSGCKKCKRAYCGASGGGVWRNLKIGSSVAGFVFVCSAEI
jgi:hypothetical protein